MTDSIKPVVLAVDDTPENLDVVKGVLGDDYVVKAAVNGKIALKIAETQSPDLILLDIMMPDMDGYEVCRRLKANPATAEIPVIFLTAKDQDTDQARGFELGAADYIQKPVNALILRSRTKTHVQLKKNLDALHEAIWPNAIAADYKAVDRVLRLMERRARTLPSKVGFSRESP